MNLHILSTIPEEIPLLLDDKRVGKMLMETNQLLSLYIKIIHGPIENDDVCAGKLTAGFSHMNHPVAKWVRESAGNFQWTISYALALNHEFTYRFGKQHASGERSLWIAGMFRTSVQRRMTPFANCARISSRGIDFTNYPVVEAYQRYVLTRWDGDVRAPKWTNRRSGRDVIMQALNVSA